MFGKILVAILTGAPTIVSDVDQAIAEFKADPNNSAKAMTVAKSVLAITEALAPIIESL